MQKEVVKPRRIVVCLDGTWDTPSEKSNVYKFSQLIIDGEVIDHNGDRWEQLHAYYSGVGTNKYRILGGVFGYGISNQILLAYEYICKTYKSSRDEIWVLGFSRGAFAVRSLTGMLNSVGVLPKARISKIEQAYTVYKNRQKYKRSSSICPSKFRKENYCSIPCINFLGCFDTVGALGVPKLPWYFGGSIFYYIFYGLHSFHDLNLVPTVKHAYHALSIHEQRVWFQPTLMKLSEYKHLAKSQVLEQVWFPGMHADVGGQQSCKGHENIISRHSLNWMLQKSMNLGLVFKKDKIIQELDYINCKFFYEDSYLSAFVYKIVPREDRVIEKDELTCSYNPKMQLYRQGNFLSFLTKDDVRKYRSKSLNSFYSNFWQDKP
ncbi:hypothetical protein BY458DRAFT_520315 [Sporodiniella umbellata]|nr:hypothetical protein BY458DRAFT_520315 [Sporodiniella umbellata]